MTKTIYFITQAKGGSGKSVLAFMLAEKYKEAIILDLDDATTTSSKQLAYRTPSKVSFLDPITKRIDRGIFMDLFESIVKVDRELFIADLGASVSEQLPNFFKLNRLEATLKLLHDNSIHVRLVCVIGGANIFSATMSYLVDLVDSGKGVFEIIVAKNGMYPCTVSQQDALVEYVEKNNLFLISFDLVEDKSERAMRNIEKVLRDGQGLSNVSPFVSVYFNESIRQLEL